MPLIGEPWFPGLASHWNKERHNVAALHWNADPDKAAGEHVYNEDLKLWLSPWAQRQLKLATDSSLFLQEYELDATATSGSLLFPAFQETVTACKSFPIPPTWTRYFSIDPHRSVCWAMLWGAVDPWGDLWIYREFWPSKICFRYERGILLGKKGKIPEEDNSYRIRDYAFGMFHFESEDHPHNEFAGKRFNERIARRTIDYAARGFGLDMDDPKAMNYQARLEKECYEFLKEQNEERMRRGQDRLRWDVSFEDAKKDRGVGEELVNNWLRPREILNDAGDGWVRSSKIHIFEDRCPELIYELKNNRKQQLTPVQAEKMDPTGKPVEVRKHMTDNLLYMVAADPVYIPPATYQPEPEQLYPGIVT